MLTYLGKRILLLLPTIVMPLLLVFVLLHLAPGDPVALMLGPDALPDQIEAVRHQLGLDRPLPLQFVDWLKSLVTLDFGQSLFLQEPVKKIIPGYALVTAELALLSLIIAVAVGAGAGVLAAIRRGKLTDRVVTVAAIAGIALPEFWLALLLIIVGAVQLKWFPVAGYVSLADSVGGSLRSLVLPALALGLVQGAFLARMTRSSMLEVFSEPYVDAARAQGMPEWWVTIRHVCRVAALPVLTMIGLAAGYLLSGAVVIETVFALPGLGRLLITAVEHRDFPLVEGITLVIAIIFVVVNLVVDVLYAALDPRVRYQ